MALGGRQHVVEEGDGLRLLEGDASLLDLIRYGRHPRREADTDAIPWEALTVPLRPPKIVAIGLNYLDHIREMGLERPIAPMLTAKFPSVLVGPNSAVVVDSSVTQRVDWEGELAVVIGRPLKSVSPSDALEGVFGYTVANDVTARDIMFADSQLIRGKNLDTFCPMAPLRSRPRRFRTLKPWGCAPGSMVS